MLLFALVNLIFFIIIVQSPLEEQVEALVHTYHDVGLIVIDTLQKVRLSDGNGGMYANDYKEAGALKKLADK